jgi:hypothetical protein
MKKNQHQWLLRVTILSALAIHVANVQIALTVILAK